MIKFEKKGTRGRSTQSDIPTLKVDEAKEKGLVGFQINRAAVELLGIEANGEEYMAFTTDEGGQRLFATVTTDDGFKNSWRIGKSGAWKKGNSKEAWEFVTSMPFVGQDGAELKIIQATEDAEEVENVYEIVAMTPEADNSPEAEQEAEAADRAEEEVVNEMETKEFGF